MARGKRVRGNALDLGGASGRTGGFVGVPSCSGKVVGFKVKLARLQLKIARPKLTQSAKPRFLEFFLLVGFR